jgi:hypothetical protein
MRDVRLAETVVDGQTEGVRFVFQPQRLDPGQRIVVVANQSAFLSRYGSELLLATKCSPCSTATGR